MEDVRERVLEALEGVAEAHGCSIVDVEVGRGPKASIRVRVERVGQDSISLDEVAEATRWIDETIEGLDPIKGPYTLEVSSPGLDRPLRGEADFRRFAGSEVTVRLSGYEGKRDLTGHLEGVEGDSIVLICEGERQLVPMDSIQRANLVPTFD